MVKDFGVMNISWSPTLRYVSHTVFTHAFFVLLNG